MYHELFFQRSSTPAIFKVTLAGTAAAATAAAVLCHFRCEIILRHEAMRSNRDQFVRAVDSIKRGAKSTWMSRLR